MDGFKDKFLFFVLLCVGFGFLMVFIGIDPIQVVKNVNLVPSQSDPVVSFDIAEQIEVQNVEIDKIWEKFSSIENELDDLIKSQQFSMENVEENLKLIQQKINSIATEIQEKTDQIELISLEKKEIAESNLENKTNIEDLTKQLITLQDRVNTIQELAASSTGVSEQFLDFRLTQIENQQDTIIEQIKEESEDIRRDIGNDITQNSRNITLRIDYIEKIGVYAIGLFTTALGIMGPVLFSYARRQDPK